MTETAGEIRIKEYVDRTLIDHCQKNDLWQQSHLREHELQAQNVILARNVLEARLHDLNEWKRASIEERQNFITRTEYESKHRELDMVADSRTKEAALHLQLEQTDFKTEVQVLREKQVATQIWVRNLLVAVSILLLGVVTDLILWIVR